MQGAPTSLADWLIVLPVLLPLLGAVLLLILRGRPPVPALAAALVVLGVGIVDLLLLLRVSAGGPVSMTMGRWLPPFGISFTVDALGAGFALVAAVVTLTILGFMQGARPGVDSRMSYYALMLLLLAGVDGAFLTGDLFNLYVWFEVMLISSFGLLVFTGSAPALDGAVKYGILNFLGTSLFLAGLGLLYGALGSLNMADIIGLAAKADPGVMTAIAALFFVAFGTKAAAFPVNAWLPASYHVPPASTSALLGGLLTKVGVYALLRTLVLVLPASRDALQPALLAVAAATLLLAPLGALAETSLRRAIGYMLIGGVGAAIAGIALPSATGIAGSVVYTAHAMLTISALYLVAGLVEAATGETDIRRMGGLYTASAPLSVLFLLLVAGVSGVPPFLGFWPKLLLLQSAVDLWSAPGASTLASFSGVVLGPCLLLNALLTLIAGARLWAQVFWRARPEGGAAAAHGAIAPLPRISPFGLGAAIAMTALITLTGLWPAPLLQFGRAAAAGLLDARPYIAAVGLGVVP